jgi:FKBP-type peptidyl-prolyl cis-trans isomerase 2
MPIDLTRLTGKGQAKLGDSVKVHYTGRFDDGTVFDSSDGRDPLEFTVGQGEVIPGFDDALIGMRVGERKDVQVAPDDGYGERNENLVQTIARDQINLSVEPETGMNIEMHTPDGTIIPLTVTEVSETSITLDANHPLAGRELHFSVELVEISS